MISNPLPAPPCDSRCLSHLPHPPAPKATEHSRCSKLAQFILLLAMSPPRAAGGSRRARPRPGLAGRGFTPQSADSSAVRQKFELSRKKDLFTHLPGHIHLSAARYQVQFGFHVTSPILWLSRGSRGEGSCHTLATSSQCHHTASRAGGFTPECHIHRAAAAAPR